jgi:hypothetical protein
MEVSNMYMDGFETRDDYIKWFKSLKVGEEVCYAAGWRSAGIPYTIVKIERITPKGWVKTENSLTFVDGEERGVTRSVWGNSAKTIQPVTDKVVRAINEHRLRNHFKTIDFQKFSYNELLLIHNFIESMKEGK